MCQRAQRHASEHCAVSYNAAAGTYTFQQIPSVTLQALANLAWSMAHLSYKHEAVLDAIVNRLLSNVDSMNQRDLADLLSALAMLKHQPVKEAMAAVVQHTSELLQEPGGIATGDKPCANRVSPDRMSSNLNLSLT